MSAPENQNINTSINANIRAYNMALKLIQDYGINIYDNKIRWQRLQHFCENNQDFDLSTATFLFACKIQRGEI